MKRCSICSEQKGFSEFYKESKSKDGFQRVCKACTLQCNRKWNRANPDRRKRLSADWYAANREIAREKSAAWRKANPGKPADAVARRRAVDPKAVWAVNALAGTRRRAMLQAVPFDIDAEYLLSIAPDFCPALGLRLIYPDGRPGTHKPSSQSATVDKIIPRLGYVRGNVAVLSKRANLIKTDASHSEIESVGRWLRGVLTPKDVESAA